MKTILSYKSRFFAVLLAIGIICYGLFEIWGYQQIKAQNKQGEIAQNALSSAKNNFEKHHDKFFNNSEELSSRIQQELQQRVESDKFISDEIQNSDFWGVSLFQNQELFAWSGFASKVAPELDSLTVYTGDPYVDIQQVNNVSLLRYQNSFVINKGDTSSYYTIITRSRLRQTNTLSIGNNAELNATSIFLVNHQYPVHFSFFAQIPPNASFSETLSTNSVDSAGVVYTLPEDHSTFIINRQNQFNLYRAIFYGIIIIITAFLLISVAHNLEKWKSLLVKLIAITVAWLFFSTIDYGVGWIEFFIPASDPEFSNIKPLINHSMHAVFLMIITVICFRPILSTDFDEIGRLKSVLTVLLILLGLLNSFLLYFFFIETYQVVLHSNIPVLDLEILPGWQTFILYLASGIWGISAIILLSLLGWFLLKLSNLPILIAILFIILGYLTGAFLIFALSLYVQIAMWIIISAGLFFSTVLILSALAYTKPGFIVEASRLRIFLLISLIAALASYIAIYKGYSDRINAQMEEAIRHFIDEEATEAEDIARTLITNLEQTVSGLATNDFYERPAFVENFFIQQNRQLISREWESFSISTQLIDNDGDIVAEYSTDLDTPAWTKSFNILSLLIPFEEEQIRVSNLRPVVRERPLNEANSSYSVFRRAWIPIYNDNAESRTGWILCSVYREKPQFEKPLRAVIASENNEQWSTSISLTAYNNGISSRRTIVGLPLDLPGYIKLDESLTQNLQQENSLYRIAILGDQKIRELFISVNDTQIIRAAAKHPVFNTHLFSLLSLFLSIMIPGLLILNLFYWNKKSPLYRKNSRFRDRLIDRFILASIICLIALIGTTYYTIKNQNQKSIQDELLVKLENLTEALTVQEAETDVSNILTINQLTSTLDADATLFINKKVDNSTATQIYSQHLLPELLPWKVYHEIYHEGNRQFTEQLTLGNQNLLQGYQPWLNEDGDIAGVVAIPTFLEAPKFKEQLLATTSYLLIFFAVIFGLFILAASLISTQLTNPLTALQTGLKKISGGDLETKLPVKSDDEIGALTKAYNVMVSRLKDLQNELAKTEREAAWKEMAQQVAHEIKNPLTPMKLNLQHLQRQLNVSDDQFNELKPQIEKVAQNMIGQIESLNKIASDFSNFARPLKEEFKPVAVHKVLSEVAELYQSDEKLNIRLDFNSIKIHTPGVEEELRRAFNNLVKNGQESMPEGGTIKLHTELNQNQVVIKIEDTGTGIPEESRDHIFVPNFSTKSSGTGLGLAITKKIIQEHGGEISFTSEVGKGTVFVIRLPIIGT